MENSSFTSLIWLFNKTKAALSEEEDVSAQKKHLFNQNEDKIDKPDI